MIYTYAHGNSFGSLHFIWKCGEEVDHIQVNQAVIYVSKQLPVFTSRDAQKSFMSKYSQVSESLLQNIFRNLTGDQIAAPTGKTIASYSTIVLYRRDHQGLGMAHKEISPQNQPQFSHTTMWQYWLGKTKPKKVFNSTQNAFNKLLQNFKNFLFSRIFY